MKRCIIVVPIILAALLFLSGCESDDTISVVDPVTPEGWFSLGWSEYESGDYQSALEDFLDGVNLSESNYFAAYSDSVEALLTGDSLLLADANARIVIEIENRTVGLTGLGWSVINLDYFTNAVDVFSNAISLTPGYADAYGGYALTLQVMEEWNQSNEQADALLTIDSEWEFSHNDVDYLDVMLIMAENYFFMADYETSLDSALELDGILGNSSGLTADDFNLATIEGRTALMNLLIALDEQI